MSKDSEVGIGVYRLFKQGGGRTAFAQVHTKLRSRGGEDEVAILIDPSDSDSATPEQDAEWFEAAVAGSRHALSLLSRRGIDTDQQVIITRLLTNLVDTTPDAIWTAAAMATAEALEAEDALQIVFRDHWTVELAGEDLADGQL